MKNSFTIFLVLSIFLLMGFTMLPQEVRADGLWCDSGNDGCLGLYSSIYDCSIEGIDHTHPINEGGSCLKFGIFWGGPNYCSENNVVNNLYACSSGSCSAVGPVSTHDVCGACGCSGASCIASPSNYGEACNINACGETGGTIQCDGTCSGTTPSLPSGYGETCASASNACGETNIGTIQCDGSCSATTPSNPPGYGETCASASNACGETNIGTIQCDGSCSATTPSNPPGYGETCASASNACGMTNLGVIDCSGACSASTPSDSLCNSPPSATNLSVAQGNNCGVASPPIVLSWTFTDPDGQGQSAYQVKIKQGTSTIHSSGKITSSSQQYSPPLGTLSYNTTYAWELKVWDNSTSPLDSGWITAPSFTTPSHQYPNASFTWSPFITGQNESTSFFDTSTAYGGSTITSWQWAFQDANPVSSIQQNPVVLFLSIGSKQADLQVIDSDGFSCSTSQNVGVGVPFPEWKEISPFVLNLLGLFAGLFSL